MKVYELDDSGKLRPVYILYPNLGINENQLKYMLYPKKVLLIVREDLRRIYIWKGAESPIRDRFVSSRVASALQEEMMKDARYHPCKIVSVDAGDEPAEFLNSFGLKSKKVSKRKNGLYDELYDKPKISPFPWPTGWPKVSNPAPINVGWLRGESKPYCKHCGALLVEGESICHVCKNRVD
jgi:hypothetical protein